MTTTFATPAGPLPAPTRVWDAQAGHYRRERCAYCTHPAYHGSAEAGTGRFFCRACITRQGWEIAPTKDYGMDVARFNAEHGVRFGCRLGRTVGSDITECGTHGAWVRHGVPALLRDI